MSRIAHPTPAQAAGGNAEDRAARLLEESGLVVVRRNYRTRLGEIDLVARDGEALVFVEVRLRGEDRFGGALASITPAKRRRIVAAARQFLMGLAKAPPCRFDVVTIEGGEARWIRGAFDAS